MSDHTLSEQTFYILLALHEPLHGYGVMQKVDNMTNSRIKLGAGTLYGAFKTLEKKGYLKFYGKDKDNPRRKLYRTTSKGKTLIKEEISRMKENLNNAENVLNSKV